MLNKLRALKDTLLVEVLQDEYNGKLIIPDGVKDLKRHQVWRCKVISNGSTRADLLDVGEGDIVYVRKYTGSQLDGLHNTLLKFDQDQILAIEL